MAAMIAQRRAAAAATTAAAPKRGARLVTRVAQPLAQPGTTQTADAGMLARAGLPPTTTPYDEFKFAPIREAEVCLVPLQVFPWTAQLNGCLRQ
jgi:thiamine thiazole synthase